MPSWNPESTELGSQIDQDGGSKSSQLGAGGHLGSKVEFGLILSESIVIYGTKWRDREFRLDETHPGVTKCRK